MKKTNKNFKRFAAITSASLLAACAVAPVFTSMTSFAAVKVNDFNLSAPSDLPADSAITNVRAYKIFAGTYNETKNTFNVTGWASEDITSETLGLGTGLTATAAAEAIKEANKDAVAKAAAKALGSGTGVPGTYDAQSSKVSFGESGLEAGYYLVLCDVEIDDKDANENATTYKAMSLGMLTVTGTNNENIGEDGNAKVGLPEVIKKVKENSSIEAPAITINGKSFEADRTAEYNDVADYNIGDKVPFKLYGSLPVDLDNYSTYYYKFTDTLGNEFGDQENLKVCAVNNGVATEIPSSIEEPEHINYSFANGADENDFTIIFSNVKDLYDAGGNKITVNSDTIITVEYDAELLETAAIGLPGQRNSVNLTYSNNPNKSGSGTNDDADENIGTTPNDEVIVFTYEIDVTKTFQDAAGNNISANVEDSIKQQVVFNLKDSGGKTIKFSKKMNGTAVDYFYVDSDNSANDAANLTLYDLTSGKIEIRGLDKGIYTLEEIAWPTGYNKAGNTTIEVVATTVNAEEWTTGTPANALTGFNFKLNGGEAVTATDYIAKTEVINKKGTTLPGTGGIGTTIFYLGGGAMAAIGGVYLISKRRMKKSEE